MAPPCEIAALVRGMPTRSHTRRNGVLFGASGTLRRSRVLLRAPAAPRSAWPTIVVGSTRGGRRPPSERVLRVARCPLRTVRRRRSLQGRARSRLSVRRGTCSIPFTSEGHLSRCRAERASGAFDQHLGEVAVRRRRGSRRLLLRIPRWFSRTTGQPSITCGSGLASAARVLRRHTAGLVQTHISGLRHRRRSHRSPSARLPWSNGRSTRRSRARASRRSPGTEIRSQRDPRAPTPGALSRSRTRGLLEPLRNLSIERVAAP